MNLLALCLFSYKWLIAVPFLIASTTLIGIPLTFVSLLGMGDWVSMGGWISRVVDPGRQSSVPVGSI